MSLGVAEARRRVAAAHFENLRRSYVAANRTNDEEAAELIQVGGRDPASKNSAKICGAYQRVEMEAEGVLMGYRKLSEDGSFSAEEVYLVLVKLEGKRSNAEGSRWTVTMDLTHHKGMAYHPCKTGGVTCPSRLEEKQWLCYEGKGAGYVTDPCLTLREIPLGFCPVAQPQLEFTKTVEDGPARGIHVALRTEKDDGQHRRLEPRFFYTLRTGVKCRGLTQLERQPRVSAECIAQLKILNTEMKKTWRGEIDGVYFYFLACSPTVWYRKLDSVTPLEQAPPPDDEILDLEECDRPVEEEEAKRRRINGQRDALLMCICTLLKAEQRGAEDAVEESRKNGSGGHNRGGARERSQIAEDFRALERLDVGVRDRILQEMEQEPWFANWLATWQLSDVLDMDERIDRLWLWLIASRQIDESTADCLDALRQLVHATVQGKRDKLKAALGRVLHVCVLANGALGADVAFTLSVDLLENRYDGDETVCSDDLDGIISSAQCSFKTKFARTVLRSSAQRQPSSTLAAAAFAVLLVDVCKRQEVAASKEHLRSAFSNMFTRLIDEVANIAPAAWGRLVSLFIGSAWHLYAREDFHLRISELASVAPEEYQASLRAVSEIVKKRRLDREQGDSRPEAEGADAGQLPEPRVEEEPAEPRLQAEAEVAEPEQQPEQVDLAEPEQAVLGLAEISNLNAQVDRVVEKLAGPAWCAKEPAQAVVAAFSAYDKLVASANKALRLPSQKIAESVKAELLAASAQSVRRVVWELFRIAETIRHGADSSSVLPSEEDQKMRRDNYIRASLIQTNLLASDLLVKAEKAAVVLRLMKIYASQKQHEKLSQCQAGLTSLLSAGGRTRLEKQLLKLWVDTSSPPASASSDMPSTASSSASTLASDVAGGNTSVARGNTIAETAASLAVTPSSQIAGGNRGSTVAETTAASPTQPSAAEAAPLSTRPAATQNPGTRAMRRLDIVDLRPDIQPPWKLRAHVTRKLEFKTGTGFQVTIADAKTNIAAFFFRGAARKFDVAVRPGVCLELTVEDPQAVVVRACEAKYGGGFQLVVTENATMTTETFCLARLPLEGSIAEVVALVVRVGSLELTRSGQAMRKVWLSDESLGSSANSVTWYAFGEEAVNVPEERLERTVVRIKAAAVKRLGGRHPSLSGGTCDFNACGVQAEQLRSWYKRSAGR
eukprot:TRINITY_DN57603_c0_g1_i1.p1 TRINITY_DN57603_c0_g1~~TRINITY_DN57603_c0_g1_i1.p1  ORF type:complete len:1176 (+),score=199.20 TRINITY_DN57603_c0_g1_i1:88-3615(+)